MKKLQRRTLFVLLFILALAAGTVVLCAFYVKDGAQWASFYGNQHVYTNGRIASGSIQDRNGTTLFDCAEGQYSDDKTTRISTSTPSATSRGTSTRERKTCSPTSW